MSFGVPYFNDVKLAQGCIVSDMQGTCGVTMKSYPRNMGGLVKSNGTVEKTMTLNCFIIVPAETTRSDVEILMNILNEQFAFKSGILSVDDNEYLDCYIQSISYDDTITNRFLRYTISVKMGIQNIDGVIRQLIPGELYYLDKGRMGIFTSNDTDKVFEFIHNVDMVRNMTSNVSSKPAQNYRGVTGLHKDTKQTVSGGFEEIKLMCWAVAHESSSEIGWKQTAEAYMYNIINGPVGDIGQLKVGEVIIENAVLNGAVMTELKPSSLRYELTFTASLQC
jgi:hypothetical protein